MGIRSGQPTQWLMDNRRAIPSLLALTGVAAFWVVGTIGGLQYLTGARSLMVMLTGLYLALAAVAVTIIIVTLALNHLMNHVAERRNSR